MKVLLVILSGFLISQAASADWTCSIVCRITTITKDTVSGISATYEEARSSMRSQCQGDGRRLVENGCGKISNDAYECRGECQTSILDAHYLSGSGATQWDAHNNSILNCQNLAQEISPGTFVQYSVGPCGQ